MRVHLRLLTLLLVGVAFGPPRSALAQTCNQVSTLSYFGSTSTTTADKKTATETVSGTSFTYGSYGTGTPAPQTNTFQYTSSPLLAEGNIVEWNQNNSNRGFATGASTGANVTGNTPNTDTNTATPMQATVTLTFTREVSNLSFVIEDIDKSAGAFTDELALYALNAANARVDLTASNVTLGKDDNNTNAVNSFIDDITIDGVTQDAIRGTATSSTRYGNVTITFSSPVKTIRLSYRNLCTVSGTNVTRNQAIGIEQIAWCAQADIQTVVSGPTSAPRNSTVTYTTTTTNLSGDVATSVTPTLTLAPNLPAASVTLPTGASYDATSGIVTFATISSLATGSANAVTNSVSFVMPVNNMTGVVKSTATANDPTSSNNDGSATTAKVNTTLFNNVPVAATITNATIVNSSPNTAITALSATDADGNNTLVSYTLVTVPNPATQGTLYVNGGPARAGQTLTLAQAAQLSFTPVASYVGTASFTYQATDDQGASSASATYSIPVSSASADVVTVISGPTTAVAGQTITYLATSTNNGPNPAAGVAATISLPQSLTGVTVTNGYYNPTTGIVTFDPIANLATGAAAAVVNRVSFVTPATTSSTSVTGVARSTANTSDPTAPNNNGTATAAAVTTTVNTASPATATAGPCAPTPGKDGAATLTSTSTTNTYFAPSNQTTSTTNNATSVTLAATSAATSIAQGDLFLVIQMQGADIDGTNTTSYGGGVGTQPVNGNLNNAKFVAGQYEYAVATAALTTSTTATTTLQLTGLKNVYVNSDYDATTGAGQRRFQVVRVPQYSALTLNATATTPITAPAWNGQTGGIVAYDVVGKLDFNNSTISVSGKGFRGGGGRKVGGDKSSPIVATATDYRSPASLNVHGAKGEGTAGTPRYLNTGGTVAADNTVEGYLNGSNGRGAPGNAGGGGTDSNPANDYENSGGGGGANGGQGGRGGNAWSSAAAIGGEPGAALSVANTNRLVLGGGGGAGDTNDGTGDNGNGWASSGAAGGGLVIIRAGSVVGTGSILASGASANNTAVNDGSGGGGAGGSILLTANDTRGLVNVTLTANGGNGGTNTPGGLGAHGPGGGGGGGIVFANGTIASASSATGGQNGLTVLNTGSSSFGSAPGVQGFINSQINNNIANASAGINCSVDLTATITGPTTASTTATGVSLDVTFANIGGVSPATGTVTRTVAFPANTIASVTSDGGTVSGTVAGGFTVTYPFTSGTQAAGSSSTFGLTYVPLATATSVTATASITTNGTPADAVAANNTSTVTTTLSTLADVTTTLSGPTTLNAGQPSGTYQATFTNNGPNTANVVTQKVTLPAGATNIFVNGAAYTPATANTIDFGNAATLNSGATNTFTYSFTVPTTPTASGNTVAMSSNVTTTSNQGTANTNQGNALDAASLALTINGVADVTTSITPGTVTTAGGKGTFTATFANIGSLDAANPTPQVQLPPGLTGVSIGAITGYTAAYNTTTGLVTYTPTSGTVVLTKGAAALSSAITFNIPLSGTVVATSNVGTTSYEAGQTANNTASNSLVVTPQFDVQTLISTPQNSVPVNGTVTYNVTTLNASTASVAQSVSPALGVVQTVQLPANLSNVYVSNGGSYNKSSGLVTFPAIASLAPGASVNNVISYSPTATSAATTITAVATPNTAVAGDVATGNNTATVSTTVTGASAATANLYTTIAASATSVAPGAAITFTVNGGNSGAGTASGVTQTVSLPAGLTGVTVSNGGSYSSTTGLVTFPTITGPVDAGTAFGPYTITANAPASGMLAAISSIGSATSDPMPGNNVATTDVTVTGTPNDVATAISGPATALAGQAVTYTVTTTNNGPTPASTTQTVNLPAGLAVSTTSASGLKLNGLLPTSVTGTVATYASGATYDASTGILTFAQMLNQAVGNSVENTITYPAPATASFANVASVSSTTSDGTVANNSAATTTTVTAASDLMVAINGPATTVSAGNPLTYTVTTTNNGASVADGQTTTVQLPTGLSNVQVSGGGAYNSTTGVVTFPAVTGQSTGATTAIVNTISFLAPTTTPELTVVATVTPTAASNDQVASNNVASTATVIAPATAALADVQTVITSNVTGQAPGSPVIFTVTTSNLTSGTAATSVAQKVVLQPGLTGVIITGGPTGATASAANYDPTTGVVTLPVLNSLANGNAASYTITVNQPATSPLAATAYVTSATSDPVLSNNSATATVSTASLVDVQIAVNGPSQAYPNSPVTYTVSVLNNGPSVASNVAYTVQLPTGLSGVTATGNGVYNATTGVVTFPAVGTELAGTAGQVTNTISFTTADYSYTVAGTVTNSGDAAMANNTASQTTQVNQPPAAYAVVNSLQAPAGNTATSQMPISSLAGADVNPGTVAQYLIKTLPPTGTLYYNGVAAAVGTVVTDPTKMAFTPSANFVGNAFFTFSAVDNQGAESTPALYTIPVGQDANSVYTAYNSGKGGTNRYVTGDVLAMVIDPNGAQYITSNSTSSVYTAAGVLQTNAANGLPTTGTNAVAPSGNGSGPAQNPTNALPAGTALDPTTGRIYVSDASKLVNNSTATTYYVNVITTDVYGGTNTALAQFTIGAYPLPVVLTAFTAQAVQNRDALLNWATASEQNSASFVVERSLDGASFTKIGQLVAQGTTSAAHAYAFTDAGIGTTAQGTVYYRLRQLDLNGDVSYSPVRSVGFTKAAAVALSLYPNPAATSTTLDLSALPASGTYHVSVLDVTGRQVLATTQAGGLSQPLDLTNLASGTYHVLVTGTLADGAALRQTLRLTKE